MQPYARWLGVGGGGLGRVEPVSRARGESGEAQATSNGCAVGSDSVHTAGH